MINFLNAVFDERYLNQFPRHDCILKKKRAVGYEIKKKTESKESEQFITCEICNYHKMIVECCHRMINFILELIIIPGNDLKICQNHQLLTIMVLIIHLNHFCPLTVNKQNGKFLFNSTIISEFFSPSLNEQLNLLRLSTMRIFFKIGRKLQFHYFSSNMAFYFMWTLIHFINCPNIHLDETNEVVVLTRQASLAILSEISVHDEYLKLIDQYSFLFQGEKLINNLLILLKSNSDQFIKMYSINVLTNYSKLKNSMLKNVIELFNYQ